MSIDTEYIKKFKQPCIRVTITKANPGQKPGVDAVGVDYSSPTSITIISCDISAGWDQSASTCTLVVDTDVDFKAMDRVVVEQGYNDVYVRTFFGFIDSVIFADFPRIKTINCRDILKLAMNNYYIDYNKKCYYYTTTEEVKDIYGNPMGGQSEYDRYAENIVSTLLVESGIPVAGHQDLEQVIIGSSHIVVGNHKYWEIVNMSAMDAINQLCDLVGYKIWATVDGMVKLRMMRAIASSTYTRSYSRETDIFTPPETFTQSIAGSIININAVSTDEDLRNWVDVSGYTNISGEVMVKSSAWYSSDYVPDPPTYRRCEIQSQLIDTQSVSDAIANQVLFDLNRLKYTADVAIFGDPRLQIGETLGIYDTYATKGEIIKYFLGSYSSNFSSRGYISDLSLTGGVYTGSLPMTYNIPPVNIWTYSGIPGSYIVCDGSNSYDPDGYFSDLTFCWYCSGYSTYSGNGYTYSIKNYDPPTSSGVLYVTLWVTDSGSPKQSRILSKTIVYSGMV